MSKLDSLLHDAIRAEDEALLADAARYTHRFSSRYRREMRRMFHPNSGARRVSRRIWAAVLASVILIGSMTATAFWAELQSFFQVTFPRYTGLQSEAPVQPTQDFYDLPDDWNSVWLPEELPEGYVFDYSEMRNHIKRIFYISDSGAALTLSQATFNSFSLDDSEGTVIPGLYVGNSSAYAWEKIYPDKTVRLLVWSSDEMFYTLCGSLTFEELISIGESLQLTEIGE